MSIFTERTTLHSIEAQFNPEINPLDPAEAALRNLNIAWANEVLKDGVIISSVPHRRSLMNFEFGELPQEIGLTLAQLFGVVSVDQITLLTAKCREQELEIEDLKNRLNSSLASLNELQNSLNIVSNDGS